MEEAAPAGATPIHRGLPDEIAIWEILVRLPPKYLLRCRAVCRAWRLATSTRDFLLAHHGRQPTLPVLLNHGSGSVDIIPFDHRAGLTSTEQLQSVARLRGDYRCGLTRKVSCDGLLVISRDKNRHKKQFETFNPTTRQYAPLQQLDDDFCLVGMYRHIPTGEYRLLLYPDTTAESFRDMPAPVVPGYANLFEMGDMLGMASSSDAGTIINIWVMEDYDKAWAFKHRVELPVAEIKVKFEKSGHRWNVMAAACDGDLLVLVRFEDWVLHVDVDGRLVASFHGRGLDTTHIRLKQTLVSHTFFPTLEGCAANVSPFI